MKKIRFVFLNIVVAVSIAFSQDVMTSTNYAVRNDLFVSAGGTLKSDTHSITGKFGVSHFGRMESQRFKIGTFVQLPGFSNQTVPREFDLAQNYPNPFNQSTTVVYSLPFASDVQLTLYSILGREIATLVQKNQAAGTYAIQFDGADANGLPLPSGVYLLRLSTKGFDKMIKIAILR